MTASEDPNPDRIALYNLARACQEGLAAWRAVNDLDAQQRLREEHRRLLEQLWQELQPDLERKALGWRRSGMAPDIRSLAMGMFAHIIGELPRLQLDPARNVRHLLLTVVQNRTVDEYRRSFSDGPKARDSDDDSAPASGSPEAQMWAEPFGPVGLFALDRDQELVDPQTLDIESQIVEHLDQQHLLDRVWSYWAEKLLPHDWLIMWLRWKIDPPVPFSEIVRRLGAGWTEEAVRQRHLRILRDARKFLGET